MNNVKRGLIVAACAVLIACGGCTSDKAGASSPDTGGGSTADGFAGPPGDRDANMPDTTHLSQANLERITAFLASDALEGRDEGSPGGAMARRFSRYATPCSA